ncbi:MULTISPECIES: glycoside hydrolase family 140 protein [Rhodomicrobium]|uniref:apiosidase-like domain-containing protein n=1 Tax=Rhodomicrobium TaxID=1068 RepID=UPI000B4B933F|nr:MULTISPECIES: glycoside hydrolase family 140 protein [Rhodomicrobium]
MARFFRRLPRRRPLAALALLALIAASAVAVTAMLAHLPGRGARSSGLVLADPRPAAAFPLKVEAGKRYLVDAGGAPFLIQGDAAWSLIADLTRAEVDIYLADRHARGFNTLLVNLIEHQFARKAPSNANGDAPFTEPGDFTKPNEAYFRHADWVLGRARAMGFMVLLTPAYIGFSGDDQGWWRSMAKAGPDAMRGYGEFLGRRYAGYDNIIWVNGGDYDPPDKALVGAVAAGLKAAAPQQLHTAHNGPETVVPEFWRGSPWLDLTTLYTYQPVCQRAAEAYREPGGRPAFLIESTYEDEHDAGPQRVRQHAYSALLCGASGQVFGNNPIWHFGHPGLFPAPTDWWHALGSQGAQSMTHLVNLFQGVPWWELRPDLDGTLVVAGRAEGMEQAVGALTADRKLALVYLPTAREISIDLGKFDGKVVSARWIDPSSGKETDAGGSVETSGGRKSFTPPGQNAAGDGDWVLVLRVAN